jgi:hypothetical protein
VGATPQLEIFGRCQSTLGESGDMVKLKAAAFAATMTIGAYKGTPSSVPRPDSAPNCRGDVSAG